MITVSILIPVYNEEKTIQSVLESVSVQSIKGVKFEVIVVDDASVDSTSKILDECKSLYSQRITFQKNKGKGAAIIAALNSASGDYVLVQDADLEYTPNEYNNLINPVIEFGAEIVIGSRFLAPSWTRVNYFWHKIGNIIITLIFNVLNNTTFTDIYTGHIVFKRSLLANVTLKRERWDQQAEILSKICPLSKIIYEVSINYTGRTYAEGKKIRALDVIPVIVTLLRERALRLFVPKTKL
jgi:glycosyltransferase involved in cell wall biosynthesis